MIIIFIHGKRTNNNVGMRSHIAPQKYELEIYSGFFGVSQDEKTLEIRPVIGYAIVKANKKEENKNDPNKRIQELEMELQRLKLQQQNPSMFGNFHYIKNFNNFQNI